jgi:tRNA-specific 2-thiouridylase
VADRLNIPHYVLNFRTLFKEAVINNFVDEYLRGRTPNPCIVCNQKIKFEALLERGLALGADAIATGHYARVGISPDFPGRHLLYRGRDPQKDQSYFLYRFTQDQLQVTLFPLGDFTKADTREMAREWGLPVAEKAESQEICFIPDDDYRSFLRQRVGEKIKPGPFLDTQGRVVGYHQGLPLYTIGQRHGLGLALGYPAYVVNIDPVRNAVTVGPVEENLAHRLVAEDNNFIPFAQLDQTLEVTTKIRSRSPDSPATISPLGDDGLVEVIFKEPQRAITPGQAVVYYQGDLVVGGGTITSFSKK